MSAALDLARDERKAGRDADPTELQQLAEREAERILADARDAASDSATVGAAYEVLQKLILHLSCSELTGAIFRHAAIEAGLVVPTDTGRAVDPCTRCGHVFK